MTGFSRYGVTPETLVLTSNGYERISTLDGKEAKVWTGSEFEETSVFKVAENVPIVRVTTTTGVELSCSEDHIFIYQPGYRPDKLVAVPATELEPGYRLLKSAGHPIVEAGNKTFPHAYTHGFYMGVEKYQRRPKVTSRAAIFGYRRPCLELLDIDEVLTDKVNLHFVDDLPADYEVPLDAGYSLETRLQWLAGLFDGGLSIRKREPKPLWHLYSNSGDFLYQIKLLIQTLGGDVRIVKNQDMTKEAYSLRISGKVMTTLTQLNIPTVKTPVPHLKYQRRGIETPKIIAVEDDYRTSDVYNFVGTKNGAAVFNGLYTASN